MYPLASVHWLTAQLGDSNLRVIAVDSDGHRPGPDRKRHSQGYIPGASTLNLERDLSAPVRPDGRSGRHPLPNPSELGRKLGQLGLNQSHTVVVYDDASGMFAARAWWLLRYLGHKRVALLDGGLQAWQTAGNPLEREPSKYAPTTFESRLQPELLVEAQDVQQRNASTLLIDSRAPERFSGASEPLDAVAGHIPGAVNLFWQESLDTNGIFLPAESQRQRLVDSLEQPLEHEEIIVYCGSGVTACVNILALELAGLKAKLYAGSWSDWISDPKHPVARDSSSSDSTRETKTDTDKTK